jgi:hypothetical protein
MASCGRMPKVHTVRRGDCMASIAAEHGFFVDTLWQLVENAALRGQRVNPYVLQEGDGVFVPDLRPRVEAVVTGRSHRFRRRGVPEKLRIQLHRLVDGAQQPRAKLPYRIALDGDEDGGWQGTTDAEGWIDEWIAPTAQRARIALGQPVQEILDVRLGGLPPADSEEGARERLFAAGLLRRVDADTMFYALALLQFQTERGLPETGQLDEVTMTALREFHGS